MPSIADTIARLGKLRGTNAAAGIATDAGRLKMLSSFGSNPGALRAMTYVPERLSRPAALVVVLHGCTQSAAAYDAGAGWSQLADRHGFALLFPEQQRQNNPNLCFNWFSSTDTRRDSGEALSIRQMIATMVATHDLDSERVFVTGLSAGGAMTSVMLATYPDVFAGGAIIAGLPYGCATTVPQALERMRGYQLPTEGELAALVRDASPYEGPWPTISIWHGSGDATVNPTNADAIIGQWRTLHGAAREPHRIEAIDGYPRRVWRDEAGREVIEEYSITGMGHGTPLDTAGAQGFGAAGPFMLEANISSTYHICRFWGLITADAADSRLNQDVTARHALIPEPNPKELSRAQAATNPRLERVSSVRDSGAAGGGVGKIIEDALRTAGLMR